MAGEADAYNHRDIAPAHPVLALPGPGGTKQAPQDAVGAAPAALRRYSTALRTAHPCWRCHYSALQRDLPPIGVDGNNMFGCTSRRGSCESCEL